MVDFVKYRKVQLTAQRRDALRFAGAKPPQPCCGALSKAQWQGVP